MTDTPEMVEWLNRIKIRYGTKETNKSLNKLGDARSLLFEDLGYDITRKQFEGLKEARDISEPVYQIKQYQVKYQDKHTQGRVHYRTVYRNGLGQFTKKPI